MSARYLALVGALSVAMAIHLSALGAEVAHPSAPLDPQNFVTEAAQAGMTEIELGKLAQAKSTDAAIKSFASRMVTDHGKVSTELAKVARVRDLKIPTALDAEHRTLLEEFNKKSGEDFDVSYAMQMAADHAKAVVLFSGATTFPDKALAEFASQTLPVLSEHKIMANALYDARK